MAKLTEPVQRYIVQQLAMWDTPSEVVESVKERFGVDVTKQRVSHYDAEVNDRDLSPKWCEMFWATRKAFIDEVVKEPAAHRAVRIRDLGRYKAAHEKSGNLIAAQGVLKQIAEEMGGAYTNTRNLQGRLGLSFEDILEAAEAADATGEAG